MNRSGRTELRTCVLAGILALAASIGLAAEAHALTGYHGCGDYRAGGELYTRLLAKSTSCVTARAVVRGWSRTSSNEAGWRHLGSPRGWRCIFLYDHSRQRFYCEKAGSRARVRFEPGAGF